MLSIGSRLCFHQRDPNCDEKFHWIRRDPAIKKIDILEIIACLTISWKLAWLVWVLSMWKINEIHLERIAVKRHTQASFTCGITEIRPLNSCRPIRVTSIPSITILPVGSANRSRPAKSELFPAPVRPTIPTWNLSESVFYWCSWYYANMVVCRYSEEWLHGVL